LYKNGKAIPRFEKFIKSDPFADGVALISDISDKFFFLLKNQFVLNYLVII